MKQQAAVCQWCINRTVRRDVKLNQPVHPSPSDIISSLAKLPMTIFELIASSRQMQVAREAARLRMRELLSL